MKRYLILALLLSLPGFLNAAQRDRDRDEPRRDRESGWIRRGNQEKIGPC
jgi:hypothetical protein